MIKTTLIAAAAMIALPVAVSAQNSAMYEINIDANWSAQTFPRDYPSSAHLSGFVAATHDENYALFADGTIATKGLETLSEHGVGGPLSDEAKAAQAKGTVGDVSGSSPLFTFPGRSNFKIKADEQHTMLSFAAMIAPSPDWFAGASRVSLIKDGKWIDELKVTIYAWDAGTDSGMTYEVADADTQPRQSVRMNAAPHFADSGSMKPVGVATLKRVIATN